jgi:hypothetical protein
MTSLLERWQCAVRAATSTEDVKRLPKLTLDRRPILTPLCNARRSGFARANADGAWQLDGVIRRGS